MINAQGRKSPAKTPAQRRPPGTVPFGHVIGGNAGEGAAVGAVVGGLFGAIRRHRYAEEQEYNADQQTSAYLNHKAAYNRAETACLTGRGYTVN